MRGLVRIVRRIMGYTAKLTVSLPGPRLVRPVISCLTIWLVLATADAHTLDTTGVAKRNTTSDSVDASDRYPFGPVDISRSGSERVRGHRPRDASLYTNYRRPVRHVDASLRHALAAYERSAMHRRASNNGATGSYDRPPDKWQDLAQPDLPIRWTPRVVDYVEYLTTNERGRQLMQGWLQRLGRYEATIRPILQQAGVPTDLVFVALAESSFDPRARSRVGAAGMWQFMESTGVVYGLESEYWVDDRFDIIKSSFAAAAYLDDLHTRFGAWELALAAYNAGYGLVAESVRRNNTNDFWTLCEIENGLPYATTNYTPKIFAAAIIARNAERFQFTETQVQPFSAITPVAIELDGGIRIERLAKDLDLEPDLLHELNAHFVRGRTPPKRKTTGYLPATVIERFEAERAALERPDAPTHTYTIRLGDDLERIAERFGTTERLLRRHNRIFDSGELLPGVTLFVPEDAPPSIPPPPRHLAAVPAMAVPPGYKRVLFRMTRASTGRDIAEAFGVNYSDLIAWNDLDPRARLQIGQMLQVVVREDFAPEQHGIAAFDTDQVELVVRGSLAHLEADLAERGLVRRGYRVRRGNTLASIGKRFDLSVGSLARINGFSRQHEPEVGETITVYVTRRKLSGTVAAPPLRGDELSTPREIEFEPRPASTATTAKLPGRE